jgi:hypothetical protein
VTRNTRRRSASSFVVAVGMLAAVSACSGHVDLARPVCDNSAGSTLALMAQSVKTASLIPCVKTTPTGWRFESLDVRQNRSRISLSSDRGGHRALRVTLQANCDLEHAVRIPSDEPQTDRYEAVEHLTPSYEGTRTYVFPGGCVTYHFALRTDRPSSLLNEATLMVGFVTRTEIREQIRRDTHGVIENGP